MSRFELRKQEILNIPLYEKTKAYTHTENTFSKIFLVNFSNSLTPRYLYRLADTVAQLVCCRPSNHFAFYFLGYSAHTMSKTL